MLPGSTRPTGPRCVEPTTTSAAPTRSASVWSARGGETSAIASVATSAPLRRCRRAVERRLRLLAQDLAEGLVGGAGRDVAVWEDGREPERRTGGSGEAPGEGQRILSAGGAVDPDKDLGHGDSSLDDGLCVLIVRSRATRSNRATPLMSAEQPWPIAANYGSRRRCLRQRHRVTHDQHGAVRCARDVREETLAHRQCGYGPRARSSTRRCGWPRRRSRAAAPCSSRITGALPVASTTAATSSARAWTCEASRAGSATGAMSDPC